MWPFCCERVSKVHKSSWQLCMVGIKYQYIFSNLRIMITTNHGMILMADMVREIIFSLFFFSIMVQKWTVTSCKLQVWKENWYPIFLNFPGVPSDSIRFHWLPTGAKPKLARHWDPLTMSYGGGAGLPSDAIELPTELMMMPGASSGGILCPTMAVPENHWF